MRKLIHICCFIAVTVYIVACKKKEQEVPIDPATGCTSCTPSYASTFVGFFKCGTYTVTAPLNTPTVSSRVDAYFSTTPVVVPTSASSTTINNVFFNSDTLHYTGTPYYYTNSLPVDLTSKTWSVNGANGIPSFSFKNLKDMPSYTTISVLPDTVRKSVGFALVVNNLKNITSASAYISDGLVLQNVCSKALYAGTDTLYFTVSNLASLNTSTTAVITIFMENAFGVKVDNKDLKMSNESSYTKRVVIKN